MVDQDLPLLHWLQPNLVVGSGNNLTVDVTVRDASSAIGAPYITPAPPQGEGPHTYVVLLYEQPPRWSVPSNYSTINPPADVNARIGFQIADFESASGLGEPVGANYFRVLNGTAQETSSAEAAATVSASSTGAASATATTERTASSGASTSSASASASATSNGAEALSIIKIQLTRKTVLAGTILTGAALLTF